MNQREALALCVMISAVIIAALMSVMTRSNHEWATTLNKQITAMQIAVMEWEKQETKEEHEKRHLVRHSYYLTQMNFDLEGINDGAFEYFSDCSEAQCASEMEEYFKKVRRLTSLRQSIEEHRFRANVTSRLSRLKMRKD